MVIHMNEAKQTIGRWCEDGKPLVKRPHAPSHGWMYKLDDRDQPVGDRGVVSPLDRIGLA